MDLLLAFILAMVLTMALIPALMRRAGAMHVLDDPSISPLHARIKQTSEENFVIMDHGSVAGTWVNFEPVASEGTILKHGDIIHIGRISLCITYSNTHHIPKLKVLNLEETQL